ncbi:MAG: hypothetical protein IKP03_04445 [Fibrobacter sp.]|nr:hypothetical protein [Fibrobacter sp.]
MHDIALLAWVKSDSTRPECIDIDGELDMDCLDSGMFLFTECPGTKAALESCYRQAFGIDFDENDVIQLLSS